VNQPRDNRTRRQQDEDRLALAPRPQPVVVPAPPPQPAAPTLEPPRYQPPTVQGVPNSAQTGYSTQLAQNGARPPVQTVLPAESDTRIRGQSTLSPDSPVETRPLPAPIVRAPIVAPPRVVRTPDRSLAAIVAGIDVPDVEKTPARALPAPTAKPTRAELARAAKAEAEEKKKEEAEEKKRADSKKKKEKPEPARIWVQVAGGANEKALPGAWKDVVKQAPAAFKGRTAYTAPLRATNRLLTGPFKSDEEAQEFVNKLRKEGIATFQFNSDPGQKIAKLGASGPVARDDSDDEDDKPARGSPKASRKKAGGTRATAKTSSAKKSSAKTSSAKKAAPAKKHKR
jgi:hypothetical protein